MRITGLVGAFGTVNPIQEVTLSVSRRATRTHLDHNRGANRAISPPRGAVEPHDHGPVRTRSHIVDFSHSYCPERKPADPACGGTTVSIETSLISPLQISKEQE